MGFVVSLFILFAIVTTTIAIDRNNVALVTPPPQKLLANYGAGVFLNYRSAVESFMIANPTFTGAIPSASLSGQYSDSFLNAAGNMVTASGTAGRIIMSYATLPTGAVQIAESMSGGDASIGTASASGTTWTSAAANASTAPAALNATVPAGAVVSVIQIGS